MRVSHWGRWAAAVLIASGLILPVSGIGPMFSGTHTVWEDDREAWFFLLPAFSWPLFTSFWAVRGTSPETRTLRLVVELGLLLFGIPIWFAVCCVWSTGAIGGYTVGAGYLLYLHRWLSEVVGRMWSSRTRRP